MRLINVNKSTSAKAQTDDIEKDFVENLVNFSVALAERTFKCKNIS